MVNLNELRGIPLSSEPMVKTGNIDEFGRIIRTASALEKNKRLYTIEADEKPRLIFDEHSESWKVQSGNQKYTLFDEKQGLAHFKDTNGEPVYYDSRIPVKEGEEPYREEVDGKMIIKFGPDHKYTMPAESENGDMYDQMRYERGGTITVAASREMYEQNKSQTSLNVAKTPLGYATRSNKFLKGIRIGKGHEL